MGIEIHNLKEIRPAREYDFIVDRTSPVGSPFYITTSLNRANVCDAYQRFFENKMLVVEGQHLGVETYEFRNYVNKMLEAYKKHGKLRLFCWCAPKRCHAETIKNWLEQQARTKDYLEAISRASSHIDEAIAELGNYSHFELTQALLSAKKITETTLVLKSGGPS